MLFTLNFLAYALVLLEEVLDGLRTMDYPFWEIDECIVFLEKLGAIMWRTAQLLVSQRWFTFSYRRFGVRMPCRMFWQCPTHWLKLLEVGHADSGPPLHPSIGARKPAIAG
ncbi:hypothetical protein [Deinococcus hopiensis]|uniref:hypothetical protein n=1 Tax=Deinococcus hopiensis TaxID=309885 RepID=UPI00111BDE87|nr:hypothetical protein [Deinococcus hopiensis]